MRGETGQRQQRRAALAEGDGLLAGIERRRARGSGTCRAGAGGASLRVDGRGDARQIVAHGEHLAARFAHGEEPPGLVAAAADRALDVGDEARER